MQAERIYNTAIYLRISKDDGDLGSGKAESNTIGAQRNFVRSFIREHKELELCDIYVDDGYSGANFDRPEFKRMMNDIESGIVDCVVVKDLSRFGRDYIEAGRLIQKTFPALNVRFIAITDSFDTLTADDNQKSLILPIKNFVNDSYCRDISQKVKSHQKVKREKGDYIGAFAVYGYRKSKTNKNQLLVDDYAAGIIKKIFAWRIDGMSMSVISNRLNQMGILSPMEYKKSNGEKMNTRFCTSGKAMWSPVAVRRILNNEMYTGVMIQGKTEVVNHKIKRAVPKPEAEWIRVKEKHEAIVSQEEFENAKKMAKVDCRVCDGMEVAHLFAGLLFCGDCKEPMIRRMNRYKGENRVYFICQTRNRGKGCTRHSILESELRATVLQVVQKQIEVLLDKEKVLARINQMDVEFGEITRFDQEIAKLTEEQGKYMRLRSSLYEDLKSGLLSKEDFLSFKSIYEEECQKTQEAIEKQEQTIKDLFKKGVAAGVKLEKFKAALALSDCTRDMLMTFVDKIYVYEDKRICIELKHKEQFRKIIMLAEFVEEKLEPVYGRAVI